MRAAAALLVASLLAPAALAAGCGGDDDGPALSESAYRAKANAICAALERDNEAALKGIERGDTAALGQATKKVGERTSAALEEIDDLDGPDAVEDATERFVDLARAFGEKAAKAADADARLRLTQEIQTAARDAGLDACAR